MHDNHKQNDKPNTRTKRSQNIELTRMRKQYSLLPLTLGVASMFISACTSQRQDARLFTDQEDCTQAYPELAQTCETAYQEALAEAQRTSPKYTNLADCEYDFGIGKCEGQDTEDGYLFMPMMAGFLVSDFKEADNRGMGFMFLPMFTSFSRYSPMRGRWFSSDGRDFAGYGSRNRYNVNNSYFKKRPSFTRTLRRGGFGDVARASARASRNSSRSWGA